MDKCTFINALLGSWGVNLWALICPNLVVALSFRNFELGQESPEKLAKLGLEWSNMKLRRFERSSHTSVGRFQLGS